MTTTTVDDLSKSDRTGLKFDEFDEFIETSKAIDSKLQEQTVISAYELLKLEHESEILCEQVASLKQELEYERQRVEEYHQELLSANSEIEILNCELQNLYNLEILKVEKAKRLAQNILSCRRFTSESLAELLSAICGVVVTADELEIITN